MLELGALAAVGYWGWQTGGAARWLLAPGAVVAVGAVWTLFVSPKATVAPVRPLQFAVEVAVWAVAAAALYASGQTRLAAAFLPVAVASGPLNRACGD